MGISHVFTSPIADGTNTQLVRPSDWNSSHAYTLQDAVSLSGNTAGVLANISSGTLYLAGGNNITLSQNGNSVTLSGANVGGAQTGISGIIGSNATYTSGTVEFTGSNIVTVRSSAGQRIVIDASQSVQTQMTGLTAGMSTNGNTSGDTGLVSNRLVLIGGNNITLSGSTNGQSMSLTISGPNVGGAQTGISGISVSDTMFTSGSVSFRNANGISFGSSGAQGISASHNAITSQSTQFLALTLAGNTLGTSTFHATNNASLFFNGGNNITLSGNGSTVTISAAAQTVQTQNFVALIVSGANGNATFTSGTVSVKVGADVTLSTGANVFSIYGNTTQSLQTQMTGLTAGFSTLGNTSGDTGLVSNRLVLAGGNNITLSGSTNGNSMTITISGPNAGGVQTGISALVVSNTTYTSGTVTFQNANGISFGSSGANGISASYTVPTQTAESQSIGMSNLGNTAGTTGMASGAQVRFVIVGTNNITLSQSVNGASGTLTLADRPVVATRIAPYFWQGLAGASATHPVSSLYVYPLHPHLPLFGADLTLSTVNILMSGNVANSSAFTMTLSLGLFTQANSSALSLLYFATSTFARTSATNQSTAFNGIRWWSFQSSQFSNSASNATTPVLNAQSEYYIGFLWATSSQTKGISYVGRAMWVPQVLSGSMGQNITSGNTSNNLHPFWGVYSTAVMPTAITASSLNATAASIGFFPHIELEGAATGF